MFISAQRELSKCTALQVRVAYLAAAFLFTCPAIASAAQLTFSPASGSFPADQEFAVKVLVVPDAGESVNAADGTFTYDKDTLSVSSFTKDGSAFSLWTAEPSFSNSAGTFVFSGGSPAAFSRQGTVLTVKFKPKRSGAATVSFSKGSVLAADGKGTNVYAKGPDASYTITDAAPVASAPDPAADTGASDTGVTLPAPPIDSPTFQKADSWYATTTALFTWILPPDVTGIRIAYSDKPDAKTTQLLKPDATSTRLTGMKEGVSYLLMQLKNDSGWGDVGKRKIQIDLTPPNPFDVTLADASGDIPAKLLFKADDALSGIDHYDILLGTSSAGSIRAKDMTDGSYPVPAQNGGPMKVSIIAYDMAGNTQTASRDLTLPKVLKASAKKAADDAAAAGPSPTWTPERILLIVFAFIIGVLVTMLRSLRRAVSEKQLLLLRQVAEIADKDDRVFSAMREEFEVMVDKLDVKPQLTPAERDFLENVREVLDLAEEVIDTGIEQLKKMIRTQ